MWRTLLGILSLALGLSTPAGAQQWTGMATLGISGGHQTNAYLDPVLNSWDLSTESGFAALTPQVGLVRNAHRTRLTLMGRARLYPRRQNLPQFVQGNTQLRYRLSPSWSLGTVAGGTRYRFASSRDTWWALPSIQWSPGQNATLTARAGLTQRYVATSQGTDRQPSGLVSLSAGSWVTDRVRTRGRFFWSNGRTSTADAQFGGRGASLRTTYWPTSRWSVAVELAAEQLQYDLADGSSVSDRIGRGGIETEWRVHSSTTVFAQTNVLGAELGQANDFETDVHVSAGIRLGIQEVLGGRAVLPPRKQVCADVDEGTRIQIPYDGPGTPHVTGDFNGWATPGIPMTKTDDDRWTATVDLPSGKYAYRIRVVTNGNQRWLPLPSYAQTAEDAFGGTNGVCTVH